MNKEECSRGTGRGTGLQKVGVSEGRRRLLTGRCWVVGVSERKTRVVEKEVGRDKERDGEGGWRRNGGRQDKSE